METASKMKQRHKMELRNLEKELKKKKKGVSKAEAKAAAALRREEMAKRHAGELAALQGGSAAAAAAPEAPTGDSGAAAPAPATATAAAGDGDDASSSAEAAAIQRKKQKKKSKAQRRRERKEKAEAEREARIAAEMENAVDERQVEIDAIEAQLGDEGLHIAKITADGHCLYRSIARQMDLAGEPVGSGDGVQQLRDAVAEHIRSHPDEYSMWLEFNPSDGADTDMTAAVEAYCNRLQTTAEWGGQVEIQVLSTVLKHPIHVYQAAGVVQQMGAEFDTTPLKVSFHAKYYTLGFHYNSVEPRM